MTVNISQFFLYSCNQAMKFQTHGHNHFVSEVRQLKELPQLLQAVPLATYTWGSCCFSRPWHTAAIGLANQIIGWKNMENKFCGLHDSPV